MLVHSKENKEEILGRQILLKSGRRRGREKVKKIMQKRVLPYKVAEEEGFEPSIEV